MDDEVGKSRLHALGAADDLERQQDLDHRRERTGDYEEVTGWFSPRLRSGRGRRGILSSRERAEHQPASVGVLRTPEGNRERRWVPETRATASVGRAVSEAGGSVEGAPR